MTAVSCKTPAPVGVRLDPMAEFDMNFRWAIVYVDDPTAAVAFYTKTFGFPTRFVGPGGVYAELETGSTTLAFAAYSLGDSNFPGGVRRGDADGPPPNLELALVHDDVDGAYANALQAGCTSLAEPEDKPHGQRVAYVRDPFGTLLEIATPM